MDTLLVFLKPPRPGLVKTRLAATLGADLAAELYRSLAEETLRLTCPLGAYSRLVCYTPEDARQEMECSFAGETLSPQRGPELGSRLQHAFADAFASGAGRVVTIGGDAVFVTRERVLEAFSHLEESDVVLGPARDGGYYLIALKAPRPGLFQGIRWGEASVLDETLERAAALGLGVHCLGALRDVDTIEDVCATWDELRPVLPAGLGARVEAAMEANR